MRFTLAVFMAAALLSCAGTAYSHRAGGVQVEVVPDRGKSFTLIPYRDFREAGTHVIKKYLEARRGDNYSIVVRNRTSRRVGVVIAVDGRNIISGEKSFLNSNEMMYIVGPHDSTTLEGWRTDSRTVHRFYFTDEQDSYSARTFGDTSAMGVIAVAVFAEHMPQPQPYEQELMRKQDAAAAPSPGKSASEAAGTGFGNEHYSPVVQVDFEPEDRPFEKVLVKYEWRETLCSMGLLRCRTEGRNRLWDEDDFAPYPPGYRHR